MSTLRRIAQRIRHAPALNRAEGLWNLLRAPYHRALDLSRQGVPIIVGNSCTVRLPAEFAGFDWEKYERQSVEAIVLWLQKNPSALVLDVGSSIGIYSAITLWASLQAEVIAFDSDLDSLKLLGRMCRFAEGNRLKRVYGFIADSHQHDDNFSEAICETNEVLRENGEPASLETVAYRNISDCRSGSIPYRSLDGLLGQEFGSRPMLVKCDVEGAEHLVLKGAKEILRDRRPQLLLSVHPDLLPQYDSSVADVRDLLTAADYEIEVIAVDHEEHWWCSNNSKAKLN